GIAVQRAQRRRAGACLLERRAKIIRRDRHLVVLLRLARGTTGEEPDREQRRERSKTQRDPAHASRDFVSLLLDRQELRPRFIPTPNTPHQRQSLRHPLLLYPKNSTWKNRLPRVV